jgi:hypothetical protein
VLRHSVSLLTLCPLGQPNKAIGQESQIELWLPHVHATVSLVALQKSNRVGVPPFPPSGSSQNGPRCKGFAAPRRNGAPLTAPGRSEEIFPYKRERTVRKLMTPASKHLAHICAIASRHLHSGRGAGCRNFSRLPARGGAFSLDILFYRTGRFSIRKRLGSQITPTSEFSLAVWLTVRPNGADRQWKEDPPV